MQLLSCVSVPAYPDFDSVYATGKSTPPELRERPQRLGHGPLEPFVRIRDAEPRCVGRVVDRLPQLVPHRQNAESFWFWLTKWLVVKFQL